MALCQCGQRGLREEPWGQREGGVPGWVPCSWGPLAPYYHLWRIKASIGLGILLVLSSGCILGLGGLPTLGSLPQVQGAHNPSHHPQGPALAVAMGGLAWNEALQVTVQTPPWRDSTFLIHICQRAASFYTNVRSAWG